MKYIAQVVYLKEGELVHERMEFENVWRGNDGLLRLAPICKSCKLDQTSRGGWFVQNFNFTLGHAYLILEPDEFPIWTRPLAKPIREGQIDTIIFTPKPE